MNSPPNSLRAQQLRDLLMKSATDCPPLTQEPPQGRPAVDGPPSPAASGPAVMSPSGSTDTAITVGSHNDNEHENDTESLTDSVREHMYENRLRYHAYRSGRYAFPNDATEQDRDEMKHIISVELCGRYFFSPVDDVLARGAEVLDLDTANTAASGTGPGHWPIECGGQLTWDFAVADLNPNSTFLGIDLSPIQPPEVPPNCHFMVDDIEHENGWDLDREHFDFIHLRHTLHSVRNRPELMQRAYEHLKPGGWFEIQELEFFPLCDDQSCPEGDNYGFRVFTQYLEAGLRALGSEMHGIRVAVDEMQAAGFERVEEDRRKCPIGDWPARPELRECGIYMRETILEGLKGLATRPFRALGWTEIQIEMFLLGVRGHVKERNFHSYLFHRTVYGRKPLESETPRR